REENRKFQNTIQAWLSRNNVRFEVGNSDPTAALRPHFILQPGELSVDREDIGWIMCKAFMGGISDICDKSVIDQAKRYVQDETLGQLKGLIIFKYGASEYFLRKFESTRLNSRVHVIGFEANCIVEA